MVPRLRFGSTGPMMLLRAELRRSARLRRFGRKQPCRSVAGPTLSSCGRLSAGRAQLYRKILPVPRFRFDATEDDWRPAMTWSAGCCGH